ncbi:hypothetical protein UWK_00057 [Desulfocapsa sulfexigens DSM 10523]|uniref:DUF8082 domain-containing protein n=1 Tax=Desulfocapsa sulfexigens (strain DSM 10523 / SB164P1) TaxID=1167006 RepID=M1PA18_DESSD|nr:hypothetical protein [Desulfocapsa sulfexigens]AGF76645.1 hypothetical protein UWK_00057 [Desulfocapsa sulfexigens DSM 10523]
MDSLLQEITVLPGVLGCFVLNSKQKIAGSKMPPIFKENSIQTIGNLIARTIQIGNMAQLEFKGIEIKYNESLLLVTPLAQNALLIIICEPGANKSLITMTTGMLAQDISEALANPMAHQAAIQQQKSATTPQPPKVAVDEAEIDADLAPILEQVKDALAMAIGPIAAPVMKDTIEIWAKQDAPSITTLPALAELLCKEINDDDLEREFMTEIKNITK